jgi:hypothetical protein
LSEDAVVLKQEEEEDGGCGGGGDDNDNYKTEKERFVLEYIWFPNKFLAILQS